MKPGDRYLKIVEWSEEDRCYVGACPGLMLGGVHGDDETAVYRELCRVVDEWVRIQAEDGDPLPEPTASREYSGKIVVRMGKDLHKEIAIEALRRGESLNSYFVRILRNRPRHAAGRAVPVHRVPTLPKASASRRSPSGAKPPAHCA
jgi:predicted HicB family RNase H-like nuclease